MYIAGTLAPELICLSSCVYHQSESRSCQSGGCSSCGFYYVHVRTLVFVPSDIPISGSESV